LVALFLVTSSSFVVFDARLTSLVRPAISLLFPKSPSQCASLFRS
jgi:hypothetical protein